MMHPSHRAVEMNDGLACTACGKCDCHDTELAAEPCEPQGFFMVPTRNPRQGSTATSPPESLN